MRTSPRLPHAQRSEVPRNETSSEPPTGGVWQRHFPRCPVAGALVTTRRRARERTATSLVPGWDAKCQYGKVLFVYESSDASADFRHCRWRFVYCPKRSLLTANFPPSRPSLTMDDGSLNVAMVASPCHGNTVIGTFSFGTSSLASRFFSRRRHPPAHRHMRRPEVRAPSRIRAPVKRWQVKPSFLQQRRPRRVRISPRLPSSKGADDEWGFAGIFPQCPAAANRRDTGPEQQRSHDALRSGV